MANQPSMNLNTAIKAFNKEMKPLGVHSQKIANNEFIVAFIANGKGSYIKVTLFPNHRASLRSGFTHPNHRNKGVGTALRAQAMRILYTSGYKKVNHLGINASNLSVGNYPISTKIVRGRLGFKVNTSKPKEPPKPNRNHNFYYSTWTPTTNTIRQIAAALNHGKAKLTELVRGKNLTFGGNVRSYIKNN